MRLRLKAESIEAPEAPLSQLPPPPEEGGDATINSRTCFDISWAERGINRIKEPNNKTYLHSNLYTNCDT